MTHKLARGLSKHYLLLYRCWSITCHSGVLFIPHSPYWVPCVSRYGWCWSQSPAPSGSGRLSDRSRTVCGEVRHVKPAHTFDEWKMRLLVGIYVFKLPSAVHISNDRRWNKREKRPIQSSEATDWHVKSSQRLTHCVLGSVFCVLCSGGLTQKPNCCCLFSVSFMFTFRVKLKDSFIGLAEIWISPLHKTARSSTLLNKNGAPSPPTPTTTTWQLDYCCDFQKCAAWIIISLWNASGPYAN